MCVITVDMCMNASENGDGEICFYSKKNKMNRKVYLSQRTIKLANKFITERNLVRGSKLFDKPDKNLQKNLRHYLYKHVEEGVQLHDIRGSKATHLHETGELNLVDLQTFMGHKKKEVTRNYIKNDLSKKKDIFINAGAKATGFKDNKKIESKEEVKEEIQKRK